MTIQDNQIIVSIDDILLVLVGSPNNYVIQSENNEYVRKFKDNIRKKTEVPLFLMEPNRYYRSGDGTLLELLTAMVGVDPGRAIILQIPSEIEKQLPKNSSALFTTSAVY